MKEKPNNGDYLWISLTANAPCLETRPKHVIEVAFDVVRLSRRRKAVNIAVRLHRGEAQLVGGDAEDIAYNGSADEKGLGHF